MLVYFEEIPPVGREFSWLIGAVDAECSLEGPLEAFCAVRRDGEGGASLEGRLKGVALLDCDRCLERYSFPLDAAFALRAEVRGTAADAERAEEGEAGAADLIELDEPCLDLDALMREQLLLALPEKRLCREDCAGLCPRCGANRNEAPCGCGRDAIDSPFAALAALKRSNK